MLRSTELQTETDRYAVQTAQVMDRGLRRVWETILEPRKAVLPENQADPTQVSGMLYWEFICWL